MTIIQPCIDDKNLVMGELILNPERFSYKTSDFIKIGKLCKVISEMEKDFGNVKCSEDLGFINFTQSNKKVIITKFGRITIQRAENKEDLLETMNYIINLLIKHKLIIGNININ